MQSRKLQAEIQSIGAALQHAERTQDIDTQLRLYEKLTRLTPACTLAHAQLAHLLFERDDHEQALAHVEQALTLPYDEAADKLIFQHLHKHKPSIAQLGKAKTWYSAHPNIWRFKLLYEALMHAQAYSEVEPLVLAALEQPLSRTDQSHLLTLLAQAYYQLARYHDCVGCYQAGLELTPNNQTQHFNLGTALEQVGRYSEAVNQYQKVLALEPDHGGVHNNLAIVMLRLGQFEDGWRQYEWRWDIALREQNQHFNIPRWSGEPLEGKTLLVWAEQGIGDHIMFSTMLSELQQRGGNLCYEIYARLDSLFERSFPDVTFLRRETDGETAHQGARVFKQRWPNADYQIPMGSLAGIFRTTRASFGDGAAYLKPDPALLQEIRGRYKALFPGRKLIGISWRGGKALHTERQSRRVGFDDLKALAKLENVQLIDLQYDSTETDLSSLRDAGIPIYHDDSVDPTAIMEAQAAQLCALDAVISVDNSTVHLAGALGVPTYALIQLNPNWRWGMSEGPSYWYNSVQIFRNREITNWKITIDRVIGQLATDGIIANPPQDD
ncbi:tetratricopeptide repeat protein [Pseudomonas putida]|uniref:Tetratricopeptide repeat protein n=1 Tax=Pseudomonas putida TaxID=303 RepID=A0AAW6PW12_PSEPU|nr:tetratricopeptide repeat protein [Pseudomonas putida]MDF3874048.1 tetratricopeptide repeat protein [Pseudomonas putida]MDF3877266.1 tetratricopeptide repeat protein [Pseudomonas putida]